MSRELWPFYWKELNFLRDQAKEFAKEYKEQAGFLGLDTTTGRSPDPHVERMIQAFALLAARVHQKIDDDFPELTEALLGLLYPHYLAPIPSMLIARLEPHSGADLTNGLTIPRHTAFRTTPINGTECEYRTVYPIKLWPVVVSSATLKGPPYTDLRDFTTEQLGIPANGSKSRLVVRLDLPTRQPLATLGLGKMDPVTRRPNSLRLFIDTDAALTPALYELLMNNVTTVVFREPGELKVSRVPPSEVIQPVGFRVAGTTDGEDEGVLPYPDHAFPGYRLMTEFFAYRDKFWFFDLAGWDQARADGLLTKSSIEVHFFFNQSVNADLEQAVSAATFKLGCGPMVNLFKLRSTEGMRITHQRYDYTIVPNADRPDGHEIYSVDEVYQRTQLGEEIRFEPFYSFRHQDRDRDRRYWYARRRTSGKFEDRGTEVNLHFVDCDFNPRRPAQDLAFAAVTCCNRELPLRMSKNPAGWSLRQPLGMSVPADISVIRQPTPTLRPMQRPVETVGLDEASRKMTYWQLLSHLSLNHLSLTDRHKGREALTEYLSLYDFSDDQHSVPKRMTRQICEGVLAVDSKPGVAFVPGDTVGGYARGLEVSIELDEEKFVSIGTYLFAAVIDRFFALAVTMNSYTRLTHSTRQRGVIRTWQPRAGDKTLM